MGTLQQTRGGQKLFSYAPSWLDKENATPMSLSMPLTEEVYSGNNLENYLWGLLPDNLDVLGRWGSHFQVSSRNTFGLLKHVGRDVAGALSFVDEEGDGEVGHGTLTPISEDEIGERLRVLELDSAAWTSPIDQGWFSLAGAQGKFALRLSADGNQWFVPTGSEPTTHIFKPRMRGHKDQTVNEHLTMRLAAKLGLPTAESAVESFNGYSAIIVERYDRTIEGDLVVRTHQEDFCQALGVHPDYKYQSDGGPGLAALAAVLRKHSGTPDDDVDLIMRAAAFNYAVWGTDAHAKNYSLLLAGSEVTLAPLYDLNSLMPYAKFGPNEKAIKLAMSVGKESRVKSLRKKHWIKLANELGLNPEYVCETVRDMSAQAPSALEEVLADEPELEGESPLPAKFSAALKKHCPLQTGDDIWPGIRPVKPWVTATAEETATTS